MDGMYVNIYMKAVDDTGKTMIGKLIQNVKIPYNIRDFFLQTNLIIFIKLTRLQ